MITKLAKFFSDYPLHSFRKREIIIQSEDPPPGIYYIQSGYVRMYQIYNNGRELTLNILKPGSFYPIIWAISNQENLYYFEAISPTIANLAPRDAVTKLLHSDPEILFELTNRLIIGFTKLLSNFEMLISASASQRITSTLTMLADRFGKIIGQDRILITLSLSHEDIARLTNLTRETTSLEMKKLMGNGLISYTRCRIIVNDVTKLNDLSE